MSKITKQNVGGTDYTMVGCALTGVCASAADAFIKAVTLSDGDEISDGMTVIVTFANGNTAGTAPASKTIYSSDQVNYYEDTGLTIPFTLAPAGCYEITYTGTGNAYTYISYPVIQIGNITGVICDASGNAVSGSLWTKGAQVGIMFKDGKFLLVSGALLNNMSALPTDAVLHYSFDEVPDYPDGTAVFYRNKNFDTSGITVQNGTLSVSEGKLKVQLTSGNGTYWYASGVNFSNCPGKIIKFRIFMHDVDTSRETSQFRVAFNNVVNTFVVKRDQWVEGAAIIGNDSAASSTTPCSFGARFFSESTDNYIIFEALYVGDGSYVTPVVDNANGQNNGTNNGGIAVKGVSGKGAYFPSSIQSLSISTANLPAPTSNDSLSISLWLKKDSSYVEETSTAVKGVVRIGTYVGLIGLVRIKNQIGCMLRDASLTRSVMVDVNKNTLVHIVAVLDGVAHTMKLYKDGVYVGATLAVSENFQFGSSQNAWTVWSDDNLGGTTSSTNNQPAAIDELLIFNRALSEAEVIALYLNRANTPKYYPPVPLNETKLNSATDLNSIIENGIYSARGDNSPEAGYNYMLDVKAYGTATKYVWQTAYKLINDPSLASAYIREGVYRNNTWTWGAWKQITTV